MNQVHRVSPRDETAPEAMRDADKALAMLDEWRHALPPELVLSRDGLSPDPSCCLLHMMHNHLLILTTRAWLLRVVQDRLTTTEESKPPPPHIKICMAAARHNLRLARHILVINQPRKLLHTGLYLLLNSAVCILMQELVYNWVMTQDEIATGHRMVDFAIETLDNEARIGNLLGRDGSQTLRELRHLMTRVTLGPQGQGLSTSDQFHFSPTDNAVPRDTSQAGGTQIAAWSELIGTIDDGWLLGQGNNG